MDWVTQGHFISCKSSPTFRKIVEAFNETYEVSILYVGKFIAEMSQKLQSTDSLQGLTPQSFVTQELGTVLGHPISCQSDGESNTERKRRKYESLEWDEDEIADSHFMLVELLHQVRNKLKDANGDSDFQTLAIDLFLVMLTKSNWRSFLTAVKSFSVLVSQECPLSVRAKQLPSLFSAAQREQEFTYLKSTLMKTPNVSIGNFWPGNECRADSDVCPFLHPCQQVL